MMKVQPAAFLRTTLPLDLSKLDLLDSGRYHSIWLPDHMVSFWPESIWTPEFTDLATVSPSPHRHLDAMVVAGAAAALTKNVPIATSVVDTVRRHPSLLAQSALTIQHLSRGRFILGLGCGETENTVPYGFDFAKPVARYEEALRVIKMLWASDGPIDFSGQFYTLRHARLDTEPYEGRFPPIWGAGSGPRVLGIIGRHCDGWWPAGAYSPEDYAEKLEAVRDAAEQAGRDPMAITPAIIWTCLIADDDAELAKILEAPLIRAYYVMQTPAALMRQFGFEHPLGDDWRGYQDITPEALPRERVFAMLKKVSIDSLLKLVPHGSSKQIARILKGYIEAGLRVPKILDYGSMAGLRFAARSAQKVLDAEDELMRLVG
jgi:phthiodiolone/phenolphthiodiolone dimycocerosates ketoreductase